MLDSGFLRPDVLVLAAGGILGEAWMSGLLAGIEDAGAVDLRETDTLIGTSAGSIVAATLAAGERPRRPSGASKTELPSADGQERSREAAAAFAVRAARGALAVGAPLVPLALAASAPGGARVRAALLARVPRGGRSLDYLRREVAAAGPRFDGRLRVVCVDRQSGRRVVFGAPGAPEAAPPDAVAASCAIPGVFEPITIGGREYVDGGVWSLTNLDVAPAGRGTHVLCLNPTAGVALDATSPLGLVRVAARGAEVVEATVLRRRGAQVLTIGPDAGAAAVIGANYMDPAPRDSVLREGYRQGREVAGD